MNTNTYLLPETTDPTPWASALYAFLAEKHRRTGSMRTVQSYSRILRYFFVRMQKTPDQATSAEVVGLCFGKGLSGKEPSAITIGSRIATISSFLGFLIRMNMLSSNSGDALERPKHNPAPARGLSSDDVKKLLSVIPDTVVGRRDRAIVLTLVLTGRRRSEVLSLQAKDIEFDEDRTYYRYRGRAENKAGGSCPVQPPMPFAVRSPTRGNASRRWTPTSRRGGSRSRRRMPGSNGTSSPRGCRPPAFISSGTAPPKLRRDAGDTVESASQFLDHSSLAVTTVYLRRL